MSVQAQTSACFILSSLMRPHLKSAAFKAIMSGCIGAFRIKTFLEHR